jgi:hypothetical protein
MLRQEDAQRLRLTFGEVEKILGRALPASAVRFNAWWGNESAVKVGHTQSRAWMNAGFRAYASIKERVVEFRRVESGLS